MPQLDTTAAATAGSLLQSIPFSNVIGGPLQACIEAQVMSNKATIDYIQAVGLQSDGASPPNYSAVNVTFSFETKDVNVDTGEEEVKTVTLTVPLLAIAPPPVFSVNSCTIDFTAKIAAAASQVSAYSNTNEFGVQVDAGWKMFGAKVNVKANYSSKRESKGSQESRYSVEYTVNVHVEAGAADMPAGLAKVLNILDEAITAQIETSP